ncbi:phospholipase D-like domain-containing protein [Actinoplanes sp. NPDC049802]|uniref:phospholipase D-like domain-containing protein n=1 Tax=Actinoplanes sp. NPDC049802 TaxID=3154742 RepID=UPI0033CBAD34
MSGEKLTVYVPCEAAKIRVRLGYQETLTPVEQVILKAVHAGASTLPTLCAVLGLSRRMALDVVQDLWRTGYLRLVKAYAGLEVTADVAQSIADEKLAQLRSAESLIDERLVMIDKLSGYVMPASRPGYDGKPRLAVPVENSPIRIDTAEQADLLRAIERGLAQEEAPPPPENDGGHVPTRPRRVLGAYRAETLTGAGGRRWLPVEIQAAVDPDNDEISVSVIDSLLPETYRVAATAQLTRLVTSRPDDPFVQALRRLLAPGLLAAPTLTRAVKRLADQAAKAVDAPAGQRRRAHRLMADDYRQLRGMIDARVESEVTCEVLNGPEHLPAIAGVIRSARTQLVIACPWISYKGLQALVPELRTALKNNVRVVLLWGIRSDSKLDPDVKGLLYDTVLRTGARTLMEFADDEADPAAVPDPAPTGPWFLAPDTAVRTHAKIVVADDRAALLTSWNMLSRAVPQHETGVRLTAPAAAGGNGGSQVIRELLRWARTAIPGYQMSQLMFVTGQDFAPLAPRGTDPESVWLPRYPSVPDTPDESDDDAAILAAQMWAGGWRDLAGKMTDQIEGRTHPAASVVIDGEHRRLLWSALRQARERLVITSDQLSGRVVDERMLDALKRAAARGVAITIRYGRPEDKERLLQPDGGALSNTPTATEQALLDLAAQHPMRLRVIRDANHAKILVWDDEAVVTSFNFLSFDGAYQAMPAHQQHSEVGVRLSGRAAADGVARSAGVAVTEAAPVRHLLAAGDDPTFVIAQRILTAVSRGDDPAVTIAGQLGHDAVSPWDVLDRLAQSSGRPLLRVTAAFCLSRHAATAPPGRMTRWQQWLVEDLWTEGRYREAALLRAPADGDFRPAPELTLVAAARGLTPYGEVLAATIPAMTAADGPVVTAVLAAALDRVLMYGDPDVAMLLDLHRARLGPDWQPLAAAALAYADASYHRPLPLAQIRLRLDRREELTEQIELWQGLDVALDRAAHAPMANMHSTRTLRELFDETKPGIFAELAVRVRGRDIREIAGRLSAAIPTGRDLDRLIDDASRAVDSRKEPIHGDHRRKLIRQLTTITNDVRALVAIYDKTGDADLLADTDTAKHLDAARTLAVVVKQELPALFSEAERSADPESRLVHEILKGLTVLQEWAELRSDETAGPNA